MRFGAAILRRRVLHRVIYLVLHVRVVVLLELGLRAPWRVNRGLNVILEKRFILVRVLDHSIPGHWADAVVRGGKGGLIDAFGETRCHVMIRTRGEEVRQDRGNSLQI